MAGKRKNEPSLTSQTLRTVVVRREGAVPAMIYGPKAKSVAAKPKGGSAGWGGRARKRYFTVDWLRTKRGASAEVVAFEPDIARGLLLARVIHADGSPAFIPAPEGLKIGDRVVAASGALLSPGNALPLVEVPVGTDVHCIEIKPGRGAQLARSARTFATVTSHQNGLVTLRLSSGESRRVHQDCFATIGRLQELSADLSWGARVARPRYAAERTGEHRGELEIQGVIDQLHHRVAQLEAEQMYLRLALDAEGLVPPSRGPIAGVQEPFTLPDPAPAAVKAAPRNPRIAHLVQRLQTADGQEIAARAELADVERLAILLRNASKP